MKVKNQYAIMCFILTLFCFNAYSGQHGPRKVKELKLSHGHSGFIIVEFESGCQTADLASCAGANKSTVAYDGTTEVGKLRTSLFLSAFMADRSVRASSWGACHTKTPGVPELYGIDVLKR